MIGDKSILSEDLRYFLVMGECELNRINQPGARSPYFMLPLPVELTEPMFESKTPFKRSCRAIRQKNQA
jgi:hypothetical protein